MEEGCQKLSRVPVHPDADLHPRSPEIGKLSRRLQDTVKDDDEGEKPGEDDGGDLGVRREGSDGLGEGLPVDLERHSIGDPSVDGALASLTSNGEVPARPEERAREDVPGNLDENACQSLDVEVVHPGRPFSHLIERSELDELGLNLLGQGGGQNNGHEDGEEVDLET